MAWSNGNLPVNGHRMYSVQRVINSLHSLSSFRNFSFTFRKPKERHNENSIVCTLYGRESIVATTSEESDKCLP